MNIITNTYILHSQTCGKELQLTGLSEDFLDKNVCRTEYGEAHIFESGILLKAWIKHTSVEVCSATLSWDFLKECLNTFDPQSIKFIRGDKITHKRDDPSN